jgi:hypothetical protein
MGLWRYSSIHSQPRHQMEVNDCFDLPLGKEPPEYIEQESWLALGCGE